MLAVRVEVDLPEGLEGRRSAACSPQAARSETRLAARTCCRALGRAVAGCARAVGSIRVRTYLLTHRGRAIFLSQTQLLEQALGRAIEQLVEFRAQTALHHCR